MIEKYKRHNWSELQKEYLGISYSSLKAFAAAKDLNYRSSQFFVNTKGWIKVKEIINMNPILFNKYSENFNKLLENIPHHFYTIMESKLKNAAATYILDIRKNPCTLEQIAEWYDIDSLELNVIAKKERWKHFRYMEKKERYGYGEYIEYFESEV